MQHDGHFLETVAIKDEWVAEFPFLRLAIGPASPIRAVARIVPKSLRVPELYICTTALGNLTATYPSVVARDGSDMEGTSLNICGCDTDPKYACVKAVAEAVERYASVAFDERNVFVATADELGKEAVDWSRLPKGSREEYARSDAVCKPFGPEERIGWVPGVSLLSGERRFVPAALAYVAAGVDATQYWLPITTGMAAHTSMEHAVVNAICEVIERDAIALTWLLRLPLPRVSLAGSGSLRLRNAYDAVQRSGVHHLMFDATTDLGIPTIYGVQLRDGDPLCATVVSCATSFDIHEAGAKTIAECASTSLSFENDAPVPDCPANFVSLEEGARYMSHPDRRDAFSFLTASSAPAPIRKRTELPQEPAKQISTLMEIFRRNDMEVFIVDMTPADVRSFGLVVVRAVIPDLMPMSSVTRFRYLGHRRLLDYGKWVGVDASDPSNINNDPQPFA